MNIASYIDHTALKPTTILADVDALCAEAIQYHFAAVCVPPFYVVQAAQILKNQTPKVATVIGFPFGYTYTEVKAAEAEQALKNGAHEIDMVANIAAIKSGDFELLKKEVEAVLMVVREKEAVLKVIIESGILTGEEIIRCCELYGAAGVDFVKTSTGYAEKGASVETVQLMRRHLPSTIKIKASGGIKTTAFARDLIGAGADRLGCSAGVAIVKGDTESNAGNY